MDWNSVYKYNSFKYAKSSIYPFSINKNHYNLFSSGAEKITVNSYDTFNKIKVISMAHDSILCVPDASQNPIILNLNFARKQARNLNI